MSIKIDWPGAFMKSNLTFSIIVPHNPERKIVVLDSLKNLEHPKDEYEIIIKHGKNPSRLRNESIKQAKGRYLAFVDDDCIVDKNWLKNAEKYLRKYNADIVGGPNLTPEDDPFFGKISGYVISSFFGTYKMSDRYKQGKINFDASEINITSANCFFKKEVFDEITGFDERLFPNEENELIARAKNAGFKIIYAPDMIVYHRRRRSLSSFSKQFFRSGRGRAYQRKINQESFRLIFAVPALFVIYVVLLPMLSSISEILLIPFLVYVFLLIAVSIYESISNNNLRAVPLLPFLFFFLHISYGLGLIAGLLTMDKIK